MINDFRDAIALLWKIKEETMQVDKKNVWQYCLPNIAATEIQFSKAERHLNHIIDPRFKAFLACANGWQSFYQSVDLFGTESLVGGSQNQCGDFLLSHLDESLLKKSGFSRQELLPIAATKLDRDLFVITRPSSSVPGTVIWFAGEEVDRFSDFDEFFLAMLEYNRTELEYFKREAK